MKAAAAGAAIRAVGMLLQLYGVLCAYLHSSVIGEAALVQFRVCKLISRQGGVCMPWLAPTHPGNSVTPGFGPDYPFDETVTVNALSRALLAHQRDASYPPRPYIVVLTALTAWLPD
jgi:hypothetical protein